MIKRIAFIGDSDSITGFNAVGIDTIACNDLAEASKIIHDTAQSENYAVIYITETLFEASQKECQKYAERTMPAIIPLSGAHQKTGIGKKRLSEFVEQAVGSDILF